MLEARQRCRVFNRVFDRVFACFLVACVAAASWLAVPASGAEENGASPAPEADASSSAQPMPKAETNTNCTGKVERFFVKATSGELIVNGSWGPYTTLCSLHGDWKGVSDVICASWLTLIRHSVENGHELSIRYGADASWETCAQLPKYELAPRPLYVMVVVPE